MLTFVKILHRAIVTLAPQRSHERARRHQHTTGPDRSKLDGSALALEHGHPLLAKFRQLDKLAKVIRPVGFEVPDVAPASRPYQPH